MSGNCTCMEVYGEDPNCEQHGIGTDHWAQSIVDGPIERAEAARKVRGYDRTMAALIDQNGEGFKAVVKWIADFRNLYVDDPRCTALAQGVFGVLRRHIEKEG